MKYKDLELCLEEEDVTQIKEEEEFNEEEESKKESNTLLKGTE